MRCLCYDSATDPWFYRVGKGFAHDGNVLWLGRRCEGQGLSWSSRELYYFADSGYSNSSLTLTPYPKVRQQARTISQSMKRSCLTCVMHIFGTLSSFSRPDSWFYKGHLIGIAFAYSIRCFPRYSSQIHEFVWPWSRVSFLMDPRRSLYRMSLVMIKRFEGDRGS